MSSNLSSEDIEIIQDFVQESRDMIELLEPTIIELAGGIQEGACWEIMDCKNSNCPRHGALLEVPCWLHAGHIGGGLKVCQFADSEQECLACPVLTSLNGDGATMNAIFRLFHSMKGSASFLDLNNLSQVAHAAESLLDLIRSGKIRMAHSHVDLLCQACDFSKDALNQVERHFDESSMADKGIQLSQKLEEAITLSLAKASTDNLTASAEAVENQSKEPHPAPPIVREPIDSFIQEAGRLAKNIEQGLLAWAECPESEKFVSKTLKSIHNFKESCGFSEVQAVDKLGNVMEGLLDSGQNVRTNSDETLAAALLEELVILQETFDEVDGEGFGYAADLEIRLTGLTALLENALEQTSTQPNKIRLGELLLEKGLIDSGALAEALEIQKKPVGEILVEMGKVDRDQLEQALDEQKLRPPKEKKKATPEGAGTPLKRQDIRVDLTKLDALVNLVGELVIAENMVLNHPDLAGLELEDFQKSGQQMNKIIRELQELTMNIRMVPVSGLFRRMIRLVHDLSSKSGKKVELQLSGKETELDKTVIETITDPLVHLLRNAIDHGLETTEERLLAGKPEKGSIRLSAQHEEGGVLIILEDDGQGLNLDKIRAKAMAKGLISDQDMKMSDQEVAKLICLPGFSTADSITSVSGRGVGMDVVTQNLEKIKGQIDITSKPGEGTRISLRIPLTLGIIDGMLARVGGEKCIIPTLAIREVFTPVKSRLVNTPDGQTLAEVRGKFHSILKLHDILLETPGEIGWEDKILILVETNGTQICLLADEILGQQQAVIKGLPGYFGNIKGLSGCTIIGDGEICLILDVGSLPELLACKEIKTQTADVTAGEEGTKNQ